MELSLVYLTPSNHQRGYISMAPSGYEVEK